MPRAIGGQSEDPSHGEQSATVVFSLERDELEPAGRRFLQTIKIAQSCIGDRPVRVDKSFDREVFGEDLAEVLDGFLSEARFEPSIVVWVEFVIGREHAQTMQLQPLPSKVIDETV